MLSSSQCLSLFSLFKATSGRWPRTQQGYVLSIPLGSCVLESLPIATHITHLPPQPEPSSVVELMSKSSRKQLVSNAKGHSLGIDQALGSWSADDPHHRCPPCHRRLDSFVLHSGVFLQRRRSQWTLSTLCNGCSPSQVCAAAGTCNHSRPASGGCQPSLLEKMG